MNRLLIAAVALSLTGGVALAQNNAPQGDYVNNEQNGVSVPASSNLDLDSQRTSSMKRDQSGGTSSDAQQSTTNQIYPGSYGGR